MAAAGADRTALLPELRALLGEDDKGLDGKGPASDDQTLLRFLRARKGDVAAAAEQYAATVAWRKSVDAAQYRRGYPATPDPATADALPERSADAPDGLTLHCGGVEIYPTLRLTVRDLNEAEFRTHCAHDTEKTHLLLRCPMYACGV